MNHRIMITYCVIGAFLFRYLIAPPMVMSMILYKSYIIRQDNGADILCDPYVVQTNDYLTKLFQQRGNISGEDFPEFLEIFKRLNPHIGDVDKIQPEQRIYIPLKKLSQNELLDQDSGVVTIPLITISNLYEFIKGYSKEHVVRKDDWVSKLIVRNYGRYGTRLYDQGLELFKLLNPEITDLNSIFPGQDLLLPDPFLRNQPWYLSLFDSSGHVSAGAEFNEPSAQNILAGNISY